ncbi:SURF1 family protein, partial [Arenibaculum sp.]|uniref:SURF1 family protein n=1 Tax=Arenibaculum sp. TaxID=2865862 RepID=UPI002E165BA7|nr:SURF1 family protein [Arenibaculum sp.]
MLARVGERIAAEPVPLPARIDDPERWDYRRVTVAGRFRHDLEMPIAARTYEGRIGYHLVTPLERAEGPPVLVDRGWIPADRLDPASRPESVAQETATLSGIARIPSPPGWFQPDNRPRDNAWYWIDREAMAARAGLGPVAPVVVEAGAGAGQEGLPVGGRTRLSVPNNHLQYALTWYSLAVVLIAIYVSFHWRRPSGPGRPSGPS